MPRFTPFPDLSSRYGAPMGRRSTPIDPDTPESQLCVSGSQGEYDCGGAYWGTSAKEGPVFAVWRRRHGRDGVSYVRAKSKAGAIRAALGDA